MDKSVAQKFTIIMSMFMAVFATFFVCGNVINDGITSDTYRKPLAKTNDFVSYSDTSVSGEESKHVSYSDYYSDADVNIVEFIDDDEDAESEPSQSENGIFYDDEYLDITTVTTTLPSVATKTTTVVKTTAKATTKTTKKTTASSKSTTSAVRTTTKASSTKSSSAVTTASSTAYSTTTSAATAATTTTTTTTTSAAPTTSSQSTTVADSAAGESSVS